MCNPAYMAMGVQAGGSVFTAASNMQAGKAQASYYNFLAEQNNRQAIDTLKAGRDEVTGIQTQAALTQEQLDRQNSQVKGSQRAVMAANGVYSDSVTSQDIARDTDTAAGRDAAAIRYNADLKSFEASTRATQASQALGDQARGFGMAGVNGARAGGINATTSILNGATQVADSWYKWKTTSEGKK